MDKKDFTQQTPTINNKLYQFFVSTPEGRQDLERLLAHFPDEEFEEVTPDTVYKAGNLAARRDSNALAQRLILPGSKVVHPEHLAKAWQLAQAGNSVLILSEHFSNFDLTNITYLADHEPLVGEDFANNLVAMAGIKLSQDGDRFISSFIKIYNRLVIIPSRTLNALTPEERDEYNKRVGPINMASLKELTKRKKAGQPILVFPTGTRTRPNKPDTAKAIKEIYGYVRSFDYILFMSLNGMVLTVSNEHMSLDETQPNVVMMGLAPVVSSEEFMQNATKLCPEGQDMRDFVPEYIMQQLHTLHDEVEQIRLATPNAI